MEANTFWDISTKEEFETCHMSGFGGLIFFCKSVLDTKPLLSLQPWMDTVIRY